MALSQKMLADCEHYISKLINERQQYAGKAKIDCLIKHQSNQKSA